MGLFLGPLFHSADLCVGASLVDYCSSVYILSLSLNIELAVLGLLSLIPKSACRPAVFLPVCSVVQVALFRWAEVSQSPAREQSPICLGLEASGRHIRPKLFPPNPQVLPPRWGATKLLTS